MTELANIPAEQIVLGAMMTSKAEILPVAEILEVGDFHRAVHGVIFDHICSAYTAQLETGPVAILESLQRSRERVDAPYLHTLIASVPVAANAVHYARIVRDLSQRRQLEAASLTTLGNVRERLSMPVETLLADAESRIAGIGKGVADEEFEFVSIQAFAEQKLEFGGPVIPGVIHQQERAIWVAGEGVGKTELGLQAGVMTAAGVHVFSWQEIPPQQVAIIDLENPQEDYQLRLRRLLTAAWDLPGWDPARVQVLSKPGGINLKDQGTQRRLMARIDRIQPNLIVAGPVYKMTMATGESGEELATITTQFMDRIRERHGTALWLEAHAPMGHGDKRDLRPMNSARWMQWPEFGHSLKLSEDQMDQPGTAIIGQFRFNRGNRTFPVKLRRASPWPWSGVYARPVL